MKTTYKCFRRIAWMAMGTLSFALTLHAQFVAYNDHRPSANTSPNATGYDMIFTAPPMPLKDFASGSSLEANLIVTQTGTPDDFGGNSYPNAGTPAYNLFNGIVDVGNPGIPGIRNSSSTSVTLTFTNLNPANFYKFRGAVVRGNNYVDRWTVFSLQSVESFTDAHVDASANNNLITLNEFPSATLTNGQVAINSGENREGSLVGWDEISPGADGTFSIRAEQYMGPTPFGNTANAAGVYGYGFTAIYLEEVIGQINPIVITNELQNLTVAERAPAILSVGASGAPIRYYWYRNGTLEPGNNLPSYTIPSTTYPADNASQFYVVLSNSLTVATSGPVTLTVTPDTTAPAVVSVIGDIDPTLVHITFSEPMNVGTISDGNFVIYLAGTLPPSQGGAQEYFTYGAVLAADGTNATITTDPRLPGQNYMLEILDVLDASSGNNPINPNPAEVAVRPTVQLIGFDVDNEWKYFIGSDIFGTGWEQPGYDDSTWASGPAGLGLDASVNGVPIRTTIPYTAQSEPSWYRKHFTFPGSTNGAILTLRDVVEDSAVYYLNGQEIFRHNVGPGTLTYATRAAAGQADPTPIQGPFNLPVTNLISGDNVLAVVVIQSGATSSDVELAVELTATIQQFAGGPPHIIVSPVGDTVNEGGTVTFSVSAEGAAPLSYQWRHGGTDIPGANSSTYTINGVVPNDGGTYTVFVSNGEGNTNSQPVTLTVIPDTIAPSIVSAVGDTNLSVVTVTLNDPAPGTGINLTSAQDPSHYQIHLTSGGGNLTVISAVTTNIGGNTVVTLTTSTPRTANQDYTIVLNNVTDRAATPNAVTPNTVPIVATVLLTRFDATWRYDDTGNDLGTTWKESAYNDSAWLAGPGVLGFETTSNTLVFLQSIAPPAGTNTVLALSNATSRVITYYFRSHVNLPLNPAGATVQAKAYIDDGAILYVNGIEQWRFNMTNGPGYTNLANAALGEPTPAASATYVVTNLTGLVQGDNVIAVEVHQDSAGSSDIDFGLQLEALVSSFNPSTQPRLNISRDAVSGQVTISWSGGGVLQQASALPATGAATWTDVPGNPNPYVFTPTPGQNRFFSLRQ